MRVDVDCERVVAVDEVEVRTPGEPPFDPTARPTWEMVAEIAAAVPEGEWDKVPSDLAERIDHYLYARRN